MPAMFSHNYVMYYSVGGGGGGAVVVVAGYLQYPA